MPEHTFTLILDRDVTADSDLLDALYEAGCDDATFGARDSTYFADFDREAATFGEALASALADLQRTGTHVLGLAEHRA